MGKKSLQEKVFKTVTRKNYSGLVLLLAMLACIASITLAYFFANDWASSTVDVAGRVDIEAVGKGTTYASIEDRNSNSNLVIYLDDGTYSVLIPGMPIRLDANCKVYQSTSKPLLRAKFQIQIYDDSGNLLTPAEATYSGSSGDVSLYTSFTSMLDGVITTGSHWLLYSDGFYYYIGTHSINATPGNTELWEVDVSGGSQVVPFIDNTITFPTGIEADFSGFNVKFIITFEAIQNFIPDASGVQLANTIINSKTIFDDDRTGGQDTGGANTTS